MQVMAQVEHVEPQQHQLYYLAGKLKEQDISQKVLKLMLYHAAKPNLLLKLPLLYLINNSKSYYNLGYTQGIAGNTNGSIKYIYHQHTDSCTRVCTITKEYGEIYGSPNRQNVGTFHNGCGQSNSFQTGVLGAHSPGTYTEGSHTYYICGKTTNTIESATIVFN